VIDKLYPPILGARISQEFGANPAAYAPYGLPGHEGIDYAVPEGTPIHAAHDGTATRSTGSTYGIQVWVTGDRYTTVYAHLSQAHPNGRVRAGDIIGYSGNTGHSTGPHLHFGVKVAGQKSAYKDWLNPADYLGEIPHGGKVSLHWQRVQPWARSTHNALGSCWVKIVNPQAGGDPFPGVRKLLRFWTDNFDRQMLAAGIAGGKQYINRMAIEWAKFADWGYVVFELPNEPGCNSNEELASLRDFTRAAIERAHELGYMVCALNLPEGNPHDNGTGDWAVAEWKMRQLVPACIGADYIGMHAYWCPGVEGPTGPYHALRYRRNMEILRQAVGYYPHVLLNECGVDGLINGHAPYKSLSLYPSVGAYVEDAMQFIRAVESDAWVESAMFFTAGYEPPWQDYDHTQEVVRLMAERIGGSLEAAIGKAAQDYIIPLNPVAAFEVAGADLGLLPASREFDVSWGGVAYRAQAYRQAGQREWQHIVYCRVGDWGNLHWFKRAN
jgi:hypothetical protein